MPRVVSDIVDVYVFRKRNDAAEFLLLRRAATEVLGGTWQAIHGRIEAGEQAWEAALRELAEETRLRPQTFYQIDAVNTFYQARDDTVHLCPCFTAEVAADAEPVLCHEHDAWQWLDFEQALARFMWPGQRRAVREIRDEIIRSGPAVDYLRIDVPDDTWKS